MRILAALAGAVALVAGCDTRLPTTATPRAGGSSSSNGTVKGPTVVIDTPTTGSLVNIGDSILVVVKLHDDKALKSVTVEGLKQTGSKDLGTFDETIRYAPVTAPVSLQFRAGLKDTTIRRYIKPVTPVDTVLDSLIVRAIVIDSLNIPDTANRRVDLVSGPQVSITAPVNGDSTPAGIGLAATARAQHPDGIGRITIRFQGEANWPTKFDTSVTTTFTGAPRDITASAIARVPADAPLHGRITVTATAVSTSGRLGNSPTVVAFVRSGSNAQPLVTQKVDTRLELADSVTISARGDGIRSIGYVARDSVGNILFRDSVVLASPFAGNMSASLSLNQLPVTLRGKKIAISGFAVDQAGRTGYAVRPGQVTPNASLGGAFVDSTLVVFGQTFPLPQSRNQGLVGDIVYDPIRENVVLSNQIYNRLEVFHTSSKSYDPNGVAVGSFPWGLFISNDPNVLWVSNSGGTNFSRVDLVGQHELDAQRIRTRITPLYTLTEDASVPTGGTTAVNFFDALSDAVLFSDRPQYMGQLSDGTVFYSTRPTNDAPKGTIRYFDPTQPFPDARPIIIFKKGSGSNKTHVVVNADSVFVNSGQPNSDFVTMCDHTPGTNEIGQCATTNKGYFATYTALKALVPKTDIAFVDGVDITDAGLTDTTYVSVSGDRNWIAFGSGHTAGSGNIVMANSSGFFSPPITQTDLTNNASEKVNGLALDSVGLTVGAHGDQSFFASVDVPFHLRLQGKYQNAASGQGITMHPRAKAGAGDVERTAYVASGNSTVEILDIFHYLNRGTLPIKVNLYGPLRAVLPNAGDQANGVILKLFGVSAKGLVVIDLRASDILGVP